MTKSSRGWDEETRVSGDSRSSREECAGTRAGRLGRGSSARNECVRVVSCCETERRDAPITRSSVESQPKGGGYGSRDRQK